MQEGHGSEEVCPICRRRKPAWEMIPGGAMSKSLADIVQQQHLGWTPAEVICATCLAQSREQFVSQVLEEEQERAEIQVEELEATLKEFEPVSKDLRDEFTHHRSLGDRIADAVTTYVGSWSFFTANIIFLAIWIVLNSLAIFAFHWDPYPFIFLNLVLSWVSVLEAPLIMMSQNRQDARDRLRDEHDFRVNLAAETEIRLLHRKLDQLLLEHWPKLVEIQRMQMELMEQAVRKPRKLDEG